MNFNSALILLHKGVRVRRKVWTSNVYLVFGPLKENARNRVLFANHYGYLINWSWPTGDQNETDWEVVKPAP